MSARRGGPQFVRHIKCADWAAITSEFDKLSKALEPEADGDNCARWIFRGSKSTSYRLEPSIERAHADEWAEAEYRILREFQSRARMHMDPAQIPSTDHKLDWLAIIQHYGAPTRLLDFTYSPYVALYFALRNRTENESLDDAEIWAIDEVALRRQVRTISLKADENVREKQGEPSNRRRVGFSSEDTYSSLQRAQKQDERWDTLARNALDPCGIRREYFNRQGLIAVASPPLQNRRLSSQQGVFLFNGAEDLAFEESLDLMMHDVKEQLWYRRFWVSKKALREVEKRLFHFNIHDLSLLPDIEGLAGFVRQRIRLHL